MRAHSALLLLFLLPFMIGCEGVSGPEPPATATANGEVDDAVLATRGYENVIEVTAAGHHDFQLSTRETASGWTTFSFDNLTDSDHFVLLYRAPAEAIAAADEAGQPLLAHWYETVTVPFQEEFNPYIAGDISYIDFVDNLIAAISGSAPWFFAPGAAAMGGPGLTSPGETAITTVRLEPGTYIVECYVKDANQEFHSYNGMLDILTVTDEPSGAPEPRPTMQISVSQDGIEVDADVRPGLHTVAVHFGDQPAVGYEHLLGHNAHLVRLEDGLDQAVLTELAAWMDWTSEVGLVSRAPTGTRFIGGAMEMPGSPTAYVRVNLKPGDYAWIAEVPNPQEKGMLKTFTVPSARGAGK